MNLITVIANNTPKAIDTNTPIFLVNIDEHQIEMEFLNYLKDKMLYSQNIKMYLTDFYS